MMTVHGTGGWFNLVYTEDAGIGGRSSCLESEPLIRTRGGGAVDGGGESEVERHSKRFMSPSR